MESGLANLEAQIILIVLLAVGVALTARRLRIPYTVALVLTGLALSLVNRGGELVTIELEPELILLAFLPGLLFESAYHVQFDEFKVNFKAILLLAVPGIMVSMLIIGFLLHRLLGLPLVEALVFGVLISATDPIAVVALFKELGVDKKLGLLVEGESLLNDGVAVVLYGILLSVALGEGTLSVTQGITDFVITVGGGALLGWGVGLLANVILNRNDDHLIDIAITVIVAYGTYWLADIALHELVSPVIAVVVAGLVVGTFGSQGGYSATSDVTIVSFWEFVAFLLNSFVFLLIGLELAPADFVTNAVPLAIAIVVILAARAVAIYGLRPLMKLLTHGELPLSWSHVLVWGGLRGAVSMALALSLPFVLQSDRMLKTLAFGYVLFSLVVQGLTAKPLIKWLGLTQGSEIERDYQEQRARVAMAQAARRAIEEMRHQQILAPETAKRWASQLDTEMHGHWEKMVALDMEHDHNLSKSSFYVVEREVASEQKTTLIRMLRLGIISDEVYDELVGEIDSKVANDTLLPSYSVKEES